MTQVRRLLVVSFLSIFAAGCGHLATYKNSVWQNSHPAPKNFSPSSVENLVDETHLRSQANYHFLAGEVLSLQKNSAEAIKEFKLALLYDKKSAYIRMRLATESLSAADISEAMDYAQEALKLNPQFVEARLLLAGIYGALKSYDFAEKQYKKILAKYPRNFEARLYFGVLLIEQRLFSRAEEQFQTLVKFSKVKNLSKSHMYLGKLYFEWGASLGSSSAAVFRNGLALISLKKSIKLDPKNIEATFSLSSTYDKMGMKKRSLRLLESFQKKFGPNKKIATHLGEYYLNAGQLRKAIKQLDYLEEFSFYDLKLKLKKSVVLVEVKQYDRAIANLEDILIKDPELDRVRFYLATVLVEVDKEQRALEHYLKIPLESDYRLRSVLQVARIFSETKQLGKTLEVLTAALKNFPNDETLHYFIASVADQLGKKDLTVKHMKKVLVINKDNARALNYLAYVYAELGQSLEEALQMAKRALTKNPNAAHVLDTVGWVLYKKDQVAEAIGYLEKAHRIDPESSLLAEHLAEAYYRLNWIKKAEFMYERTLKLESVAMKKEKSREGRPVDQKRLNYIRLRLTEVKQLLRKPAASANAE